MRDLSKVTEFNLHGILDIDNNDVKIETLDFISNTVSLADILRQLDGKTVDLTVKCVENII